MKKLKYLAIFFVPLSVGISFTQNSYWTFLPLVVFFGLVPLVELFFKPDFYNLSDGERLIAEKEPFYDWLLYLMVPIQIYFLFWYISVILRTESTFEIIGRTQAMGFMCGVIGINVGHELGHRSKRFEQFLSEILLLTSLENHFMPYHNRGHHLRVATPEDPATARKKEVIYLFWLRSHFSSYFQAWKIELNRMKITHKSAFGIGNKMVVYSFAQLSVCLIIYLIFGLKGLLYFLIVATLGILLLETVNYIEHYGLLRKKRENGTYERVRRIHSWNSNHIVGRVLLFELSRHSDHHYKPDRPYQILESHDESPIMPTGYPGMMVLALIPPLFFIVMNKRVEKTLSQ
jgi:alkane 1-monooxygenase